MEANENQTSSMPSAGQRFIKYFVICFILMLVVIIYNVVKGNYIGGFGAGLGFLIIMTLTTTIGAFIGDSIRRWLMPSFVFTREGALGLAKAKLFWAFGPQIIGWIIGMIAGANMLKNLFGLNFF